MSVEFKIGQKVRHIANPEFNMVVKDFAVRWENDTQKIIAQEKNPEYPVCSYYNVYTHNWEEKVFMTSELLQKD